MKPAKFRKLEPVTGTIQQVLDKLGLSEQMAQYRAVLCWEKAAGAQVSKHARAYSIDKGVLLVFVDSHVWIRELIFLKAELLRKLNAELGAETVKDIRFAISNRRKGE